MPKSSQYLIESIYAFKFTDVQIPTTALYTCRIYSFKKGYKKIFTTYINSYKKIFEHLEKEKKDDNQYFLLKNLLKDTKDRETKEEIQKCVESLYLLKRNFIGLLGQIKIKCKFAPTIISIFKKEPIFLKYNNNCLNFGSSNDLLDYCAENNIDLKSVWESELIKTLILKSRHDFIFFLLDYFLLKKNFRKEIVDLSDQQYRDTIAKLEGLFITDPEAIIGSLDGLLVKKTNTAEEKSVHSFITTETKENFLKLAKIKTKPNLIFVNLLSDVFNNIEKKNYVEKLNSYFPNSVLIIIHDHKFAISSKINLKHVPFVWLRISQGLKKKIINISALLPTVAKSVVFDEPLLILPENPFFLCRYVSFFIF